MSIWNFILSWVENEKAFYKTEAWFVITKFDTHGRGQNVSDGPITQSEHSSNSCKVWTLLPLVGVNIFLGHVLLFRDMVISSLTASKVLSLGEMYIVCPLKYSSPFRKMLQNRPYLWVVFRSRLLVDLKVLLGCSSSISIYIIHVPLWPIAPKGQIFYQRTSTWAFDTNRAIGLEV